MACRYCNAEEYEYYVSDARACKPCIRTRARENREKRIEKYRAYDRERGNRQTLEDLQRYRQENPEKYRARSAVSNALRGGRLTKPDYCSSCGAKAVLHGHHDDYSRPLDVVWLCTLCHKARHKELGWGYVANAIEG